MADEATTVDTETTTTVDTEEQHVPYDRFKKVNAQAKEAKDRAKALETEMAELRSRLEERESAGLPELEQMKRQMSKLEERAARAEAERDQTKTEAQTLRAQGLIAAAARDANFEDPEDAVLRISANDIESPEDAERAVKRLAKAKPRLVKAEEPRLPGQVLKNGRTPELRVPGEAPAGSAFGLVNKGEEAVAVGEALAAFRARRQGTKITFDA